MFSIGFSGLLSGSLKTSLELVNASAGIDKLLLTCIERMALGADFDVHITLDRVRGNGRTASASDGSFLVFGMDSGFHFDTSSLRIHFNTPNYSTSVLLFQ